jgi:hypothetical protein
MKPFYRHYYHPCHHHYHRRRRCHYPHLVFFRLRALSDGSTPAGPTPVPSTKFKLADYRYGREEMLALCQESYLPAEELRKFPHIFVEETQTPISLLLLSEDEQVRLQRSVAMLPVGVCFLFNLSYVCMILNTT